ncbi:Spc7-domain-containing protein [Xylaria intraflava]|nr:Spc7-domain-containing protein [Xylaria intraflava]
MAGHDDVTLPSTRRPRKSTGHSPVRKRMEKENITVDLASTQAGNAGRKKSRSKSIGPGGLDVLKSGSGNRRVSLAAPTKPPPRSILKPTMPQLPEIPPHKSKGPSRKSPPSDTVQGLDKLPNPFRDDDSSSSGTKIALRTEEEQQAAAREREEKERAQLEKEIKDRREARRKSLANRRVSFAAEATLHTFHEIEYMQDSTTSTDSTRRASSLAAQPSVSAGSIDPPSTPPDHVEDLVPASPEDQRNPHGRNQHRSSGMSALDYNNNQDDLTVASSVYSSDSEATEGVTEVHEEIESDSGSDSDADGVTMDLEMTGTSIASAISARSGFTDEENDSLDDALRLATRRAETQQIDEEEEIIPFFSWVKKPEQKSSGVMGEQKKSPNPTYDDSENTTPMDMEITRAVGGIILSRDDAQDDPPDADMSMDVTRAFGGIFPSREHIRDRQIDVNDGFEDNVAEDTTMDLSMAIGSIRNKRQTDDLTGHDNDEDLSMELTTVMGGVVSVTKPNAAKRRVSLARRSTLAKDDEATMDMTIGLGRIIPTIDEDKDEADATMDMDMTTTVGKIIREPSPAKDQIQAGPIMGREVDVTDGSHSFESPVEAPLSGINLARDSPEIESPSMLLFRRDGLGRSSIGRGASVTPKRKSPDRHSPFKLKNPGNLDLANTPEQSSPIRTPASLPPQRRSPSPKRPTLTSGNNTPKSATKRLFKSSIFQQDPATGVATPQVVLTPQKRRLSGIGADRPGLGSPKVAAIFERRGSIGDTAGPFVPRENLKAVSFIDPQVMEGELDWEREQEQARENGSSTLSGGADGDGNHETTTLKDMISSMTPKKKPLKGRKSLHVGSASGLLGKRPAELDEEDDDGPRDGIKRLKNHQSSPVKNVRLRAPPSKEETTGRPVRSTSKELDFGNERTTLPSAASPNKESNLASSPPNNGHFEDLPSDQPTSTFTFHDTISAPSVEDKNGQHIHLQDFLNMTSIRFMELTTTKRRHTQVPNAQKDALPGKEDLSLERCIVAGACTVPMLELYQHSCRELKKYISEGRRIVREIETETFEENPPLFKEYISATPEFKTLMDNQFKNVKTHARLLSKAMWYEWRMKLQDGLKEGLVQISEGMVADEKLLQKQQALLSSTLPRLNQQFESLTTEHENLEAVAQELADCNPEDLQSARTELTSLDLDIEAKKRKIEELQKQLTETESNINDATERKKNCVADIGEAEKVREECRGWTSNEINSLKAKVDELEKQHGWGITGVAETTISMTYKKEIELVFDVASFRRGNAANSRIDLWYVAANRDRDPQPASPEKEFFIRCIRDHVRGMVQARTKINDMLQVVSCAWKKANHVAFNVRLLNCTFPTKVTRTSDSSIAIRSTLLLVPLETKVEIVLSLHGQHTPTGVQVSIVPQARVIYGEQFKVDKVVEYLTTRMGTSVVTKEELAEVESWSDIVVELHERLLARGRK